MFEDVVVGIRDREAGRDAVALAKELVSRRGQLTLAHVDVRDPLNVDGEIDERLRQAYQRLAALEGAEPHAESADDAVEGLHPYGATVELLVIGAHDYTPVDHLLEQSTSERLADHASTPLVVLAVTDSAAVQASE